MASDCEWNRQKESLLIDRRTDLGQKIRKERNDRVTLGRKWWKKEEAGNKEKTKKIKCQVFLSLKNKWVAVKTLLLLLRFCLFYHSMSHHHPLSSPPMNGWVNRRRWMQMKKGDAGRGMLWIRKAVLLKYSLMKMWKRITHRLLLYNYSCSCERKKKEERCTFNRKE